MANVRLAMDTPSRVRYPDPSRKRCGSPGASLRILFFESGLIARFGFAYGTLIEHAERGEERFTVEWNRSDDQVWYSILAFSVPNKPLAKLGYPLSRMLQRKFAEGSRAAMLQAINMNNQIF